MSKLSAWSHRLLPLTTWAFLSLLLSIPIESRSESLASIRIETKSDIPLGSPVTLSIYLDSIDIGVQFGGFDLLLDFDRSALQLSSVEPGELLNNCGWEYFVYRTDSSILCDFAYCPTVPKLHIVGIADINDASLPLCPLNTTGELAKLHFQTSHSPNLLCNSAPVRFFWDDCQSNTFVKNGPDTMFISDRVFEVYGSYAQEISDPFVELPAYTGAPNSCLTAGPGGSAPVRGIDFYNGWVWITCEDTVTRTTPQFSLYSRQGPGLGATNQVAVRLDYLQTGMDIGQFDFTIEYDTLAATLLSVIPGEVLTQCQWELFEYYDSNGTVRVIGLADVPGTSIGACPVTVDTVIAYLNFAVTSDSAYIYRPTEIRWKWSDCENNLFGSTYTDDKYAARQVLDRNGFLLTTPEVLPSTAGAPDSCLSVLGEYTRGVDLRHGGWGGNIPGDPNDSRGDINLNALAYEIVDWVLFLNYFSYGPSLFTVDLLKQKAASDVNADGIELGLDDLVYLYRVILGDATPFRRSGEVSIYDTVTVFQDTLNRIISVSYTDSLSTLFLIFDDSAEFQLDSGLVDDHYFSGSPSSKVLIGTFFTSGPPQLPQGVLLSYTGDAHLLSAFSTNSGLYMMPTIIEGSSAANCCIQRGNIDNDPSNRIDIGDLLYFVEYMFGVGQTPPCLEATDIDGYGMAGDISDLLYLVDYMFASGLAPAPCP